MSLLLLLKGSGEGTTILASDDFANGTIDSPPWGFNKLCTETGGELRIEANSDYEGFLEAEVPYNLEHGFVSIKLDTSGFVGEDGEFFFRIEFPDGLIHFDLAEGNLVLENGEGDVVRIPYDADEHAYLRLRFDGTNACWDTSADGVKWINRRTVAAAVDISEPGLPYFQAGRFAEEGTGYFAIDDYEVNSEAIADFLSVTTGEATSIGGGAATLNGTVVPSDEDFTWWFEYGLTRSYGLKTTPQEVEGGEEPEAISAEIEDLDPGAHHFRLVVERAEAPGTLIKGNDELFEAGGASFAPSYFAPNKTPWNRKLSASHPPREDSEALVAKLVEQLEVAPPWINTDKFSTPVYIVEESQPTIKVTLEEDEGEEPALQEAFEAVPLPEDAVPAAGTDMHLSVYQPSTDRMWEFWQLRFEEGEWRCTWGGAMENVSSNVGRFDVDSWPDAQTYWGATATSLPLVAGLMTIDELEAGEIPHALALAIPEPSEEFIWPAQRSDGYPDLSLPPEGVCFRLPASFDVEGMEEPEIVKVICRAIRDYGLILRDVAGAVVLYGEDPGPSESDYESTAFEGHSKGSIMEAIPWSELVAVSLEAEPAIPALTTRVAVNREFPPTKHCVIVRDPKTSAPIARWAEDEAKAHNVMNGLRLSGTMPGGRKELRCALPRDPRQDWPDMEGFLEIECQLPGRNRIWHGRIGKAPRSDGDRMVIEGEAVGYAAALEDRKALRLGFIDPDLSRWGEPSVARRVQLSKAKTKLLASTSVGSASQEEGEIGAAIVNDFNNVETLAEETEAGEAHYSSGGIDIGEIPYDFLGDLAGGAANSDWESNLALGTTDIFSAFIAGEDHDASAALNQRVGATAAGYQFARLRNRLITIEDGISLKRIFGWQLKVISLLASQNLALLGTWPNVGYTVAQMLRLAIPLHSELRANEESVEDDGLVVTDAWFPDHGTLARVVDELVKLGLYDWFVKDAKLFELREPGTYGRRWQASMGPSNFQEAGVDTERSWDRIVGAYRDPDGSTRTVGWPGSGANTESEQLIITDPDHPAVRAGVVREDILDLQVQSTPERAIEVCERWLSEANELSRSGKARLTGYVQDECGAFYPAAEVAEGDLLRFRDARDKSYRKIVNYDYAGDDLAVDVDLDAPSEDVKALLERYRAALYPLGVR